MLTTRTDAATTPPAGTGRTYSSDTATVNHANVDISAESKLSIEMNIREEIVVIAAIAATAASVEMTGVVPGMY